MSKVDLVVGLPPTPLSGNDWGFEADCINVDERRRRELVRIRQIYVPELIIRLHSLLVSSKSFVPECVLSLSLTCSIFLTL